MEQVGIRELKAQLSAYVAAARNGERIVITDRGVAVAEIVPVSGATALQRLIDAGVAMPPTTRTRSVPTPRRINGTLSDLVAEQRR